MLYIFFKLYALFIILVYFVLTVIILLWYPYKNGSELFFFLLLTLPFHFFFLKFFVIEILSFAVLVLIQCICVSFGGLVYQRFLFYIVVSIFVSFYGLLCRLVVIRRFCFTLSFSFWCCYFSWSSPRIICPVVVDWYVRWLKFAILIFNPIFIFIVLHLLSKLNRQFLEPKTICKYLKKSSKTINNKLGRWC